MKTSVVKIWTMFFLIVLIGMVFIVGECEITENEHEEEEEEEETIIAPMEKKEKEALYSAIQGFVGKWWNGSDLYPDPCGWTPIQGVSCDLFNNGFWYVTTVNIGSIYDNSLECSPNAHFTYHLFQLHHLKSLSFFSCFNRARENPVTIPTSNWYNLRNTLQTLEFRSNPGLIGPIPEDFSHLKCLKTLVLIENGLTGELPFNLGDLVHLQRLVLSGNRFVGPLPVSLGGLTELLIFDSSRNFLSGPLPLTFGGLTSLLKLDLSNNLFEGILPSEIRQLKNLTLLDLGNNKFTGGFTQSFQEMVSLEELVLSNNPMGGDLMNIHWESFQSLKYLDLSNMGLMGEIPKSMTKMRKLRFLGLSNNSLYGNVPQIIEAMPSISSLYLDGNNLEGELGFSDHFYSKMGTRFRASNNPNLCCHVELTGSRRVPIGLKQCEKGNNSSNKETNGNIREGFPNKITSNFVESLESSSCVFEESWWGFMGREIALVLLLNVLV